MSEISDEFKSGLTKLKIIQNQGQTKSCFKTTLTLNNLESQSLDFHGRHSIAVLYTVKPGHVVTSIKQSPVLKVHFPKGDLLIQI